MNSSKPFDQTPWMIMQLHPKFMAVSKQMQFTEISIYTYLLCLILYARYFGFVIYSS